MIDRNVDVTQMDVCVYAYTQVLSIESLGAAIPPISVKLPGMRKNKMRLKHLLVPESQNVLQE